MSDSGKLTQSEQMKLLAGLAVQPFLAAAVAFVFFPFLLLTRSGQTFTGGYPTNQTDAAISVAVGTAFAVVPVTALVVLPVSVWMMKRGPVGLMQALLFGLALADIPLLLGYLFAGTYGVTATLRSLTFASLIGLAGAAAFWMISLRGHASRANEARAATP